MTPAPPPAPSHSWAFPGPPAVDTQSRGRLSFQAYHHLGGVNGALAAYAERTWADVPDADKPVARRLLPRLVRVPMD